MHEGEGSHLADGVRFDHEVVEFHHGGDGGVEGEAFDVVGDFFDEAVEWALEGCVARPVGDFGIVVFVEEVSPHTLPKTDTPPPPLPCSTASPAPAAP